MMSCKALLRHIVVLFGGILSIVGCTTDADYTLGSEFLPSDQRMELRRRCLPYSGRGIAW